MGSDPYICVKEGKKEGKEEIKKPHLLRGEAYNLLRGLMD
jgi:hypothetical protein